MTTVMFPDNTVLVNFAHLNRVALLGVLFPSRQWCATVASECGKSATVPGLSDLHSAPAVFGAPLYPNPAEHVDTQILRTAMSRPDDERHKHLGEAETIAIVSRRRIHAVFVTDDRSAKARAAAHGILVIDTWRVFQLAHRKGLLTAAEVWADLQTLAAKERGGPPKVRSKEDCDAWLQR